MRCTGFKTLQFQITQCKDCKHLVGIHSVRCFSCIGLHTCLYVHMFIEYMIIVFFALHTLYCSLTVYLLCTSILCHFVPFSFCSSFSQRLHLRSSFFYCFNLHKSIAMLFWCRFFHPLFIQFPPFIQFRVTGRGLESVSAMTG